jgi:hypothetical protein
MEKFPIATKVTFVEMGMVHDNLTGPCTNLEHSGLKCPTPKSLHVDRNGICTISVFISLARDYVVRVVYFFSGLDIFF